MFFAKLGGDVSNSPTPAGKVLTKTIKRKKPKNLLPQSTKSSKITTKNGREVSESRKDVPKKQKLSRRIDSDDEDEDEWNESKLYLTPPPQVALAISNRKWFLDKETLISLASDLATSSKQVTETNMSDYVSPFSDLTVFTLKLPFGSEEYLAVSAKSNEDTGPLEELDTVISLIAEELVPEPVDTKIKDPAMKDCILRRVRRAIKAKDQTAFLKCVEEFNNLIDSLSTSGDLINHLSTIKGLSAKFIYELLNQSYRRIVSPKAEELRNYEAFSSNVYGELLPHLVSDIFKKTRLTPDSVFIDLGSGVGNCVLQAALEVGCESWGCEVMPVASNLGIKQKKELESRVQAYGISVGSITLLSSDFLENPQIHKALQRADVILVNNYAFDAELNSSLLQMFLDTKEGCRIVSLKSFVPPGHVISKHNIESPLNILEVEHLHFGQDSVSWTTAGGDYYISTVSRSRLASYM